MRREEVEHPVRVVLVIDGQHAAALPHRVVDVAARRVRSHFREAVDVDDEVVALVAAVKNTRRHDAHAGTRPFTE